MNRADALRKILLIVTCVAINLAGSKFATTLALPVYLDTIGTLLSAVLLPWYLAFFVAFGTASLASAIIFPGAIFYVGTHLTIILIAVWGLRLGAFSGPVRALLLGVGIAIAAAVVSAPVTVLLFGGVTVAGATAINAILIASGENIWKSVATGALVVESLDKPASALLVYYILRQLPLRLKNKA